MHHETYIEIRAQREADKEQRKKDTAEKYRKAKEEKAAKRAEARAKKRDRMPEKVQMAFSMNRFKDLEEGASIM